MAADQQRVQQLADAEARRWWSEREAKAEKDMSLALHKRMEAQRAQIHAFKLEQSKWEHELQLRISKYAHDRKLLSEHNIELQEALTSMEEKYAKLQRESDLQATRILELEGELRDSQRSKQQLRDLRVENEALSQRLMHWESFHNAEVATAVQHQANLQSELMVSLEKKLGELMKDNERLRESHTSPYDRSRRGRVDSGGTDGGSQTARRSSDQEFSSDFAMESLQARVAELEKACKQKDQSIVSLRSMLERHESISDEKFKLTQAKYVQVKALNVALQQKLLQALTDCPLQQSDHRIERDKTKS